jgi:hypothetical protein
MAVTIKSRWWQSGILPFPSLPFFPHFFLPSFLSFRYGEEGADVVLIAGIPSWAFGSMCVYVLISFCAITMFASWEALE